MVKILFFGDLVDTLGMASDEISLPPDVTDVERLLFVLSTRGEIWKKMLLGNPKLNITINKQFAEKSAPVKDGDEVALVGFAMI
ncbi:MoaD/ThiS family protein [Thiobacillus sp.]|jgi:molybdopterin synthase sulfur carrier subunit|uniref:MoaD/ThiS family protein n=1 Tax=Thiobacillus sp. TaxID=924 RepID=UPI0008C1BF81|nr:MoaD/ThiS family protein [Thiobacillus sp.]OGU37809.1 MAG: molybdopterin synthase sulfur carrier subunit [Hydrogenophilales bacterium RIFOXYA1_FULL_63_33]